MRMRAYILAIAAAVLLAACGETGVHYDKSPEQVAAALKAAHLPTHVLGGNIKRSRVTQPDASTVVTALVAADGSEAMRFVTTITPDGSGSRVLTEVQAPEGQNAESASRAMASEGYAMALMGGLANEHVAAAIEGRPFDMLFAANPMAKEALRNKPGVQEQINRANASAARMARMEQDMEQDGPADASGTAWEDGGSEPAFGQPMDDARGSF